MKRRSPIRWSPHAAGRILGILLLGLTPSLCLPFDPKLFGQAANNGQMLGEANAKSKAAEAIAGFARAIARRETAAVPGQKPSILGSLLKLKS